MSQLISAGDAPWREDQSEEDPVRPESGSAGEASEAGGDGEEKDTSMRKPKIGRIPKAPTKRELEEHLPLHMPYKSWCPICVSGEGMHNQSRMAAEEERERLGTTISLEYRYFTTDGGVRGRPERS